jgi:protein phosphatase-4 regulatory subunit 3
MADRGTISEDKRVKLYLCNEEGQWDDQGTGYVSVQKAPSGRYNIVMRSETEAESWGQLAVVLNTPLSMNDIYEMQGDTLLVWEDPFMSQHLALSFQSAAGCIAMMDTIKAIQQGQVDTDDDDDDDVYLPEPEITSLGSLHETLSKISTLPLHMRRHFASRIAQNCFLDKLFDIFDQCEDLDDVDSLHKLFRILITIILFNDVHLLLLLFENKFLLKLMGVLEFDPVFKRRLNHRQYLERGVEFQEVIPLKPDVKETIHETFRLQYFKDTVVTRYLDDATLGTLNGLVMERQTKIITDLCSDDDFLDKVVQRLSDGEVEEKASVLRLMQEMHTLAKSLMPQGKAEFLAKLCSKGIFRLVGELIMSTSPEVRRLAVDIVSQSCQQEPGVLRGYIVDEESKGRSVLILYNVVLRLVSDSQDSERVEMVEILKQLLETGQKATTQMPERAVVTDPEEMSRLLEIFLRPMHAFGNKATSARARCRGVPVLSSVGFPVVLRHSAYGLHEKTHHSAQFNWEGGGFSCFLVLHGAFGIIRRKIPESNRHDA